MRSAAAALMAFSGELLAHPGPEGHFHGLGIEHGLLLAVVLGFLFLAVKK